MHLCLTLIIKEFKISTDQDRVVITLNIIFSVLNEARTESENPLTRPTDCKVCGRAGEERQGL